ncbi:penicillin-binding protein [Adhaeribacter soli]|uniref:Penicillin-binding protein n=1 Tax=Adhaeribacter soli TaxID=2607655 RepID=A0A5N1IM15_9BACT|nr:penicillin-binding protein [Adhaeribacter soli]
MVTKVEAKYPAKLHIGKSGFANLTSVEMENIALVPNYGDTLLQTKKVHASISFRTLLKGRIIFNELEVSDAYLTAVKYPDNTNNYSFLLGKKPTEPVDTTKSRNYGKLLNDLIEKAFESVPDQVNFQNLNVSYTSPHRNIAMKMPELTIADGEIKTALTVKTDSLVNNLRAHGTIDPGKYFISARLYALDTAGIVLPYVKQKFGGDVSFDTLAVSLSDKRFSRDMLTVRGNASITGLTVNHSRISDTDVKVKSSAVDYVVSLGPDYYAVDSLTEVRVNKMKIYPVVQFRTKPAKDLVMRVHTAQTPANDFFGSLPEGMFDTVEGIKGEGSLSYTMKTHINFADLKHLTFDSDLEGHNFKILQYGKEDLSKMNRPFQYTAYEYGKPVRTFTVGPGNPFFAPYNSISPYLKNTIMTSEDAGFFRHKGFHEEAFRQSIATNIKAKKFARGGSTISMQLVKNVFLSRKKTIARKAEEALIVWLIENNKITSKTRMYEVYLNIIEWGPNVYGIKDASRFYFGKQPSELTLAESIYLAHIIPKPKAYRSAFDAYGNLKPHVAWYYRLISGIMLRRGQISQEEYDALQPAVDLYGRARDLIVTAVDTTSVTDTLQLAPIDMMD